MAKRTTDVEFKFVDNFTTSFKATIETLKSGSKAADRAWKGVQKGGESISKFGAKMTAGVTVPLVGLGVASVKSFGEVDKTLRLVQQTMGSTEDEAKLLEGSIKTAAANSVFGMRDAADASLNFARQGFAAAEAANMLTPAMDLAAGTATDLSTITGGLGNTLKAFGAGSEEAAHYSDMMAKAQAQANTTVEGLFEAMSIAGSTAKTVGWDFSDLAVLTGVFGDHSISASEGATALNTGLMRLASPAKEGSDWLERLGINVFDSDGKLRSMSDTMEVLQEGFAGLSDQEQLAAASAIFGKNQAAKWVTLINGPGGQALEDLKAGIEGAEGASHGMADALMSGTGGSIEKLKSSFDVFKFSAGAALGEAVTPFIEKLTDLIDKFNQMDPEQQKQIAKWAAMAAAAGPAIMIFGKLVTGVGTLGRGLNAFAGFLTKASRGFKAMGGGAKLLRGGIAAFTSPLGLVIAGIALLIVVVLAVKKHFDVFKKGLSGSSKSMEHLKVKVEDIKEKLGAMKEKLAPVADFLGIVLAGAAGAAVGGLMGLLDGAITVVDGVLGVFSGLIDFITGVFTGDWDKAWRGVLGIFTGITDVIMGIINGITGALGGIISGIGKLVGVSEDGKVTELPDSKHERVHTRARGDVSWRGGIVQVHERGGEIIDLPHGSRIYPHDVSMQMAKSGGNVTIAKIADQVVVREQADIDRLAEAMVRKVKAAKFNRGGVTPDAAMA